MKLPPTNSIKSCVLYLHYLSKIFKRKRQNIKFSFSHLINSILFFFSFCLKSSSIILAIMAAIFKHDEEEEYFYLSKYKYMCNWYLVH